MCTSDNFTFYLCTPCTFTCYNCYIFTYISLSLSLFDGLSHYLTLLKWLVAMLLLCCCYIAAVTTFSPGLQNSLLQHIVLVQMAAFWVSMVAVVVVALAFGSSISQGHRLLEFVTWMSSFAAQLLCTAMHWYALLNLCFLWLLDLGGKPFGSHRKLETDGWQCPSSERMESRKVRWNHWHFRGGDGETRVGRICCWKGWGSSLVWDSKCREAADSKFAEFCLDKLVVDGLVEVAEAE